MKVKYILRFSLLILIATNSCKRNKKEELPVFPQLEKIKNGTKIYVIPGSGCSGCISVIESLAINNQNSDSLFFIFTRLNSLKLFRNRFGISFWKSTNILIDTNNTIHYNNRKLEIYPLLYYKINGQIVFEKYIKPLD